MDVSSTGTGGGRVENILFRMVSGWTNGVTLKMLDLICPKRETVRQRTGHSPRSARRFPACAAKTG
ncbi:trehalase [Citrobacter koseri]|uniref:Trehalase n=1 Tax=Citrobacter koseri TaxID=545 RepID=A0A2X2VSI8_CITKO|nr:trehalase [Citrobacter koseri]